jgi:hypothetical protein
VHEDCVGAFDRLGDVQPAPVHLALQLRERERELPQGALAVAADEVVPRPRVLGLVHPHVVPARDELAHDAAQEVRVAVVPVRDERVDEEDEPHDDAARSAWGSAAATSSYSST